MNWGSLILLFGKLANGITGLGTFLEYFFYGIWQMIPATLFKLWSGIAWFVDQVEELFRKLAGVGTPGSEPTDMAGALIKNPAVRAIFENLCAVGVALLIFFTILKIIQIQYKDKNGGNPYIIVFRMLKGILMFSFVTAAVLVGIYASGVVFRALDAATGGGDISISGQVFEAMAADANRLRVGKVGGLFSKANAAYYNRLVSPYTGGDGVEDLQEKDSSGEVTNSGDVAKMSAEKYCIVQFKDVEPNPQSTARAYANLGINKWAVVNADGSYSPLSPYGYYFIRNYGMSEEVPTGGLQFPGNPVVEDSPSDESGNDTPSSDGDDYNPVSGTIYDKNYWDDDDRKYANLDDSQWDGTQGTLSGDAGYKNQFFTALDVKIVPKIDLSWSPLKMYQYDWLLATDGIDSWPFSVMGNSTGMGMEWYKFKQLGAAYEVDLPEGRGFSINIHGQASLQGDTAAAGFTLDLFHQTNPLPVLMGEIIFNYAVTVFLTYFLAALPALPLRFFVGPVSVNAVPLVKLIIKPCTNALVKGMHDATFDAKANADFDMTWFSIGSGNYLPITYTQYAFNLDFMDLWGQLMDSWDDTKDQIFCDVEQEGVQVENDVKMIDNVHDSFQESAYWNQYQATVNEYNKQIASYLQSVLVHAYMYKNSLTSCKFPLYGIDVKYDSFDEVGTQLVNAFQRLVGKYNQVKPELDDRRPTAYTASPVTGQIYLPAFTTTYSSNDVASITPQKIVDELTTGNSKGNLKFNLMHASYDGIHQIIDWSCYDKSESLIRERIQRRVADTGADWTKLQYGLTVPATIFNMINAKHREYKDYVLENDKFGLLFPREKYDRNPEYEGHNTPYSRLHSTSTDGDDSVTVKEELRASTATNDGFSVKDTIAKFKKALGGDRTVDAKSINSDFNSQIVTFRDMSVSPQLTKQEKADIKVLTSWLRFSNHLVFDDTTIDFIRPLYEITQETAHPEKIDALMASRYSGRRYLTIGDGSTGNPSAAENQLQYVGVMSYTDNDTVLSLYNFWKMNYIVGFMGLVVAMSVYMNFIFGLIQRAVNMAVLYIMSPLTIAFFPYDDGEKFNSMFVKQFYKETISAFAIIMSLNLFFALVGPVQKAVEEATGTRFMRFIALVAFCSMLPNIRNSITSILGAANIQEKHVTDMFSDAGKTLSSGTKKWGKVATSAVKTGLQIKDQFGVQHAERLKVREAAMEARRKAGKSTKLDDLIYKHRDNKKKNEEALDRGRAGDTTGLSRPQIRRLETEIKAAERKAKKEAKKGLLPEGMTVAQRTEELKQDMNFRKNASGVVAEKFRNARAGVKAAKTRVADKVSLSYAAAVADTFIGIGSKNDHEGNFFYERRQWRNVEARKAKIHENNEKKRAYRESLRAADAKRNDKVMVGVESAIDADHTLERTAQENAAQIQAQQNVDKKLASIDALDKGISRKKFIDAAADWYVNNTSMSLADAAEQAKKDYEQCKDDKLKRVEQYGKFTGKPVDKDLLNLDVADQAKDILNNNKLDNSILTAERQKLELMVANNSADGLKGMKAELSDTQMQTILNVLSNLKNNTPAMQKLDAKTFAKVEKTVVEAIKTDPSRNVKDVVGLVVNAEPQLKVNQTELEKQLQASGFEEIKKVQNELSRTEFTIKSAIKIKAGRDKLEKQLGEIGLSSKDGSFQHFYQAFREANDTMYTGSVAHKEQELKIRLAAGSIDQSTFDQEMKKLEPLRIAALKKVENAFHAVGSDSKILSAEFNEREAQYNMTAHTSSMAAETVEHWNFTLKMMDDKARNCIIGDTEINQMFTEGKLKEAAQTFNKAVDAALHDGIITGLEEKTANILRGFATSAAGREKLEQIRTFFEHVEMNVGDVNGPMGTAFTSESFTTQGNALANVFQMSMCKIMEEQHRALRERYGQQEANVRYQIDQLNSQIDSSLNGPTFDNAFVEHFKNLKFVQEHGYQSMAEMVKDMSEGLNLGRYQKNDDFKKVLETFSYLRNGGWNSQKLGALSQETALTLRQFGTDLFTNIDLAGKFSDLQNVEGSLENKHKAATYQAQKKMAKEAKKG